MRKLAIDGRAYGLVVAEDLLFYRVHRTSFPGPDDAYFRYDFRRPREITAHQYNRAKYQAPLAPYQDNEAVAFLPGGATVRCSPLDSVVRCFGPTGQLLRELPASIEAAMEITSIAVDAAHHLWTAVPGFHQVAQYELAAAQKLYEVGGSWEPGEFNHPESVICYEQALFVSDMGHRRLVQLNPHTKALRTYRTFAQAVWEYRRVRGHEVVHLQDGLYVL